MSQFLSRKYLQYTRTTRDAIDADRACAGCGYNLRGLKTGGACPECGERIEEAGRNDVFRNVSMRSGLRVGLGLATLCLVVAIVNRLILFVMIGGQYVKPYLVLGSTVAVIWVIASWLLTPPELEHGNPSLRWPRRLVRLTQPIWLIAYAIWFVQVANSMGTAVWLQHFLLRGLAGIGAVALASVLSVLASDAGLDRASRNLSSAAWFLPLAAIPTAAFVGQISWFFLVPLGIVLCLWWWSLGLFALGLYRLYKHTAWSERHDASARDRGERIKETRAELDQSVAATIRPMPRDD